MLAVGVGVGGAVGVGVVLTAGTGGITCAGGALGAVGAVGTVAAASMPSFESAPGRSARHVAAVTTRKNTTSVAPIVAYCEIGLRAQAGQGESGG
jgi:hypothetical protein